MCFIVNLSKKIGMMKAMSKLWTVQNFNDQCPSHIETSQWDIGR